MPAISILIKPASGICNLSCDYCFYCDETKKRSTSSYGMMSEDTLEKIMKTALLTADGPVSFAYQGGEPTLRGLAFFEKAVFFQQKYNQNRVPVSNAFQTNGYLLDEDWCRFFKQNHFLLGLSLDGTKELHDRYRHTRDGKPTYDKIRAAAALLDRFSVDYNLLTVVTGDTACHIREIYEFYREQGFHYQQYIACLDPLGEPHGQSPWALTPGQYGQFLIDLFDLWYEDLQKGYQPFIRQFENLVALALGYPAESCEHRGVCGLQYVTEADGSVYPCDFYMLDSYRLGNFHTDDLASMDKKRAEIGFFERSRKLDPACMRCPYYRLCRGGCQRNRDAIANGDYYTNYFCQGYRMFFGACQDKLMRIATLCR